MAAWEMREVLYILVAHRCDMGLKERAVGNDFQIFYLNSRVNGGAIFWDGKKWKEFMFKKVNQELCSVKVKC